MLVMGHLFLDALRQAADAVLASSADAARTVLAAQQALEACRNQNNPGLPGNSWIQGMKAQNLVWAPDPCQQEQAALDNLNKQSAVEGNQEAIQGLGGAPAPQLATDWDPTPQTDPAIPESEYIVPEPGAASPFLPLTDEELRDLFFQAMKEIPLDQEMIEQFVDPIMSAVKYYHLWCPWGGPGVHQLKWKLKYKPNNQDWIGKWCP